LVRAIEAPGRNVLNSFFHSSDGQWILSFLQAARCPYVRQIRRP
jgi:hypothetical protein